eukprot:2272072-Rhodomonas_salina.2
MKCKKRRFLVQIALKKRLYLVDFAASSARSAEEGRSGGEIGGCALLCLLWLFQSERCGARDMRLTVLFRAAGTGRGIALGLRSARPGTPRSRPASWLVLTEVKRYC